MRLAATAAATQLTQAEQQVREAELGPDRVAAALRPVGQAEAGLAEARPCTTISPCARPQPRRGGQQAQTSRQKPSRRARQCLIWWIWIACT